MTDWAVESTGEAIDVRRAEVIATADTVLGDLEAPDRVGCPPAGGTRLLDRGVPALSVYRPGRAERPSCRTPPRRSGRPGHVSPVGGRGRWCAGSHRSADLRPLAPRRRRLQPGSTRVAAHRDEPGRFPQWRSFGAERRRRRRRNRGRSRDLGRSADRDRERGRPRRRQDHGWRLRRRLARRARTCAGNGGGHLVGGRAGASAGRRDDRRGGPDRAGERRSAGRGAPSR